MSEKREDAEKQGEVVEKQVSSEAEAQDEPGEKPEGPAAQEEDSSAKDSDVDRETPVEGVDDGSEKSHDAEKKPVAKKTKVIGGIIAAVVALLIGASLLPCQHEWKDATCTEPKTCTKCKETEGDPLGHDWAEATCEKPKTCKRCGETTGSALGHKIDEWTTVKEATCSSTGTREGTCTRCGKKQQESIAKLDHTPGDWEVSTPSTVASDGSISTGTKTRSCTVCGAVLDKQTYKLEVTTSQRNALRTAQSYLNTMAFSHKGLVEQLEYEGYSNEDATFAADNCGADWNVQAEKKAESYLSFMGFSHSGLVDQLEYEGFTPEQAEHGVSAVGL